MIFPYLILSVASLAALAYFARKNVTWTAKAGTKGSLGMAIIVVIIAAFIGWGLDVYFDWSVVPLYMYAVGGALQAIAIVFFALYALLCLSMLYSAAKVGTMVS
jgi:preprotein translocase subunit SecE